jgi:hypothetical protein
MSPVHRGTQSLWHVDCTIQEWMREAKNTRQTASYVTSRRVGSMILHGVLCTHNKEL